MIQKPDTKNTFNFKKEEGINPYIGIMSFQHFNGEKLYSDCVVKEENHMTETEAFECYPVTEGVPENGRNEGYYPDSSVCYIRVLWKEFEPKQGEYNYKFIEDIINEAKAHNQSLIFRLMAHSTCERDDVPNWLKEIIDCPIRPDGKRVKDSPTDPLFLELFSKAIKALGEKFDDNPVFDAIDISLPGAWGEGYKLDLYSGEQLKNLVDTYTSSFKNTQLIGQLARPELVFYASKENSVGWRGDGLGDPRHTKEIYPPKIEILKDVWKTAPVSFESYWWLCEWQRQGWDIDEVIEKTLSWHISSFNPKSIPIPYEWKDKIEYWLSKMGYHFMIKCFEYPKCAKASDTLEFKLTTENTGVAPIYKKIPLKVRLSNGENSYESDTDIDIRKWLPGENLETFCINLPNDIKQGNYSIEIGIFNELNPIIYLCTDAKRNGSYYTFGEIEIK